MNDCQIVKDLLPLVAEDMASEASKTFVEKHIETCADCKKAYEQLKTPVAAEPAAPLKSVRRQVKKHGWLIAGLIACLVAALLVGTFDRLTKPIPIHSGYEAFESVHIDSDRITLYQTQNTKLVTEKDGRIIHVGAYTTLWDQWTGKDTAMSSTELDLKGIDAVIFEPYNNTDHEILYQRVGYPVESGFALPRLVMNYYFAFALMATVAMFIPWLILFLKKSKARRVFDILLLLPLSGTVALLFAGFPATTIDPLRELIFVCITAILLFFAGLCGRALFGKE